jgi:hypothetical protein
MAVADDDGVGLLDVGSGKAERRIVAAAIEIGVEQDDLAVIGEFEIGKAGPAHRERVRVLRRGAAGRRQTVGEAGWIARLRGERTGSECIALIGARIGEWLSAGGAARER